MSQKTVMTITGIRPDFVRMAATFKKLDAHPNIKHIMVHTGQHYNDRLSSVFFDEFGLREPDYNLGIGGPGKDHIQQAAELSIAITKLIREIGRPDLVVFLGDSNSVSCAFTLKKEGISICHIEAGMRSGDKRMIEEINRTVCDHCSDLLMPYHKNYAALLEREGIVRDIRVVGNTIVEPCRELVNKYKLAPKKRDAILVDIHRPENFNDVRRMQRIVSFAKYCGDVFQVPVQFLAFPRTLKSLEQFNIALGPITPVDLMSFSQYTQRVYDSVAIISDSGTAQEECVLFETPCVVPRDFTERWESVSSSCSVMLEVERLQSHGEALQFITDPFIGDDSWLGDGLTSQHIVENIDSFLQQNT